MQHDAHHRYGHDAGRPTEPAPAAQPAQQKTVTEFDKQRLAAAKAKRERKAKFARKMAKRASKSAKKEVAAR